jgi:hypothetical protein
MVAEAHKLTVELGQVQAAEAAAQRAATLASAPGLVAELGHDVEADAQDARAQQEARSVAQAKRLGEAIAVGQAELASLVALDQEHGPHLDGLAIYYHDPRRVPGHYDYGALQRYVLVPAWEVLQTLRPTIYHLRESAIPEARRIIQQGWRPGQEWALHAEDIVLSLTRPQGLARSLADQIAALSAHLKRITTAARLRKQSGAEPTQRLTLPKLPPPKPGPLPAASITQWDPFK